MEDITTPREKVLKKIRASLLNKFAQPLVDVDQEKEVFQFADSDHAASFAKNLTEYGSGFVYCHNRFDFIENLISFLEKRSIRNLFVSEGDLKKELENTGLQTESWQPGQNDVKVALVEAEALVARNGSFLVSSRSSRRALMSDAELLLVAGRISQLADDMKQALVLLKNRYGDKLPSLFAFYHGPSRWVDDRRNLIKSNKIRQEVIFFLINDQV